MKNIKVLHIGKYYYPYKGGTESHLFTLVKKLKKEIDVEVLASNTIFKTSIENIEGVKIYRLACLGKFFSVPLNLSLPFWLKRKKADILHFHLPNPVGILSYFLARPKGKVIVSYHSDIIRQKFFAFFFKPFLIKFLKKTEIIIVSSERLIANSPILIKFKDKCQIIPQGIDIERFRMNLEILKKAEEIKHIYESPLVLFVGRLVYYKGLEYLIKAMKYVNAKLLIVGTGPLRNRLENLARNLRLNNRIIWFDDVEDEEVVHYYHACDVFVLPSSSKAESFGIVQLEAFACQKAVVSTDLPTGVPFVNQDGKTGIVVPPRNYNALAGAINKLLSSAYLQKNYGQNGKVRVEKEFNSKIMADEVLRVYKSMG